MEERWSSCGLRDSLCTLTSYRSVYTSFTMPTLGMSGWLILTQCGLAPHQLCQALPDAQYRKPESFADLSGVCGFRYGFAKATMRVWLLAWQLFYRKVQRMERVLQTAKCGHFLGSIGPSIARTASHSLRNSSTKAWFLTTTRDCFPVATRSVFPNLPQYPS